MQWLPCKGTVLKRAASSAGPSGSTADQDDRLLDDALCRHGPLLFCSRCGYYAEQRGVGLERPCTGHPAKNYGPRLVALLAGVHPRSGRPLPTPRVKCKLMEA